jgi:poly-gamma-glutamate biosynthesis protein PgsC/CapC
MNEEILILAIGVGLVVSLLFSETFGIAAGGMVVPGYLALSLGRPRDVALTLLASAITFGIVRVISAFLIVYGKRRTSLMILFGYLMGILVTWLSPSGPGADGEAMRVVGYIIPGLVAIWLDRQGVVETLSAATTAAIVVRLLLILILGGDFKA